MGTRRTHIWYDADGSILAFGHTPEEGHQRLSVVPRTAENQSVLETDVPEELLGDLHRTHRVDISRRTLVEYPGHQ